MEFTEVSGKVALVFDEMPAFVFVKTENNEAYAYEKGRRVVDADRVAVYENLSVGTKRPFPREGSTVVCSSGVSAYGTISSALSKVFEIKED